MTDDGEYPWKREGKKCFGGDFVAYDSATAGSADTSRGPHERITAPQFPQCSGNAASEGAGWLRSWLRAANASPSLKSSFQHVEIQTEERLMLPGLT